MPPITVCMGRKLTHAGQPHGDADINVGDTPTPAWGSCNRTFTGKCSFPTQNTILLWHNMDDRDCELQGSGAMDVHAYLSAQECSHRHMGCNGLLSSLRYSFYSHLHDSLQSPISGLGSGSHDSSGKLPSNPATRICLGVGQHGTRSRCRTDPTADALEAADADAKEDSSDWALQSRFGVSSFHLSCL